MASSRQVIRTLDLPHRQDELKKKLAASKQQIRRALSETWMREAEGISTELMNQLLSSQKPEDTKENMDHSLFAWQKMNNLPNGKSWKEQWSESRGAMQAEHNRRTDFNRKNYVPFGDFSDKNSDNTDWGFEGLSVEEGECYTSHGDSIAFCPMVRR